MPISPTSSLASIATGGTAKDVAVAGKIGASTNEYNSALHPFITSSIVPPQAKLVVLGATGLYLGSQMVVYYVSQDTEGVVVASTQTIPCAIQGSKPNILSTPIHERQPTILQTPPAPKVETILATPE
jgi:hypothetical protein